MGLDLRFPIGLLLLTIGLLLTGYGIFADPAVNERSLGINVDFIWGLVLVVAGIVMVLAARRAKRTP